MTPRSRTRAGSVAGAGSRSARHVDRAPKAPDGLAEARERARARGIRWTPQRNLLLTVLTTSDEHIGGAELVKRCRALDATTTPSTVYRNLDLLEELGVVSHHRHPNGHEEFHYRHGSEHGHLHCRRCGHSQEVGAAELAPVIDALRRQCGFEADIAHTGFVGLCAVCSAGAAS